MLGPWTIYLSNAIDALRLLGAALIALSLVLLFLDFLLLITYEAKEDEKYQSVWEEYPYLKRGFYAAIIILLVGFSIRTVFPPKEKIAAIIAVRAASEKKLSIDDTLLLKKKVLKLINGSEEEPDNDPEKKSD